MQIIITSGTGEGSTPHAAFDAALIKSGIANYNLICLSSIIPVGSDIQRTKFIAPIEEYGYRLYVVMARHDERKPGKIACAGLGWVQDKETGRGLFVEQHGTDKAEVQRATEVTLESMMSSRPYIYGQIQYEMASIECHEKPVCAVVIAVYQSQGWES